MGKLEFRLLNADEIDVRVQSVTEKGLILLLYKDARCDMNILDETVGPMDWKREHTRDNANCIVSIWDSEKLQWISKEDTGTESFTEKEKGLASDSFKRACFNRGIGRELYTSPFIWISNKDCEIKQYNNKWTCNDKFKVSLITYKDRCIEGLEIYNTKNKKKIMISYPNGVQAGSKEENKKDDKKITDGQTKKLFAIGKGKDTNSIKAILNNYGYSSSKDILIKDYDKICKEIEAL